MDNLKERTYNSSSDYTVAVANARTSPQEQYFVNAKVGRRGFGALFDLLDFAPLATNT